LTFKPLYTAYYILNPADSGAPITDTRGKSEKDQNDPFQKWSSIGLMKYFEYFISLRHFYSIIINGYKNCN